MSACFFVSDLHGVESRYRKLLDAILAERPRAVFLGGDLLPSFSSIAETSLTGPEGFLHGYLVPALERLRQQLGSQYPHVFAILGNDDAGVEEVGMLEAATKHVWEYVHARKVVFEAHQVYGYCCVPPTPFLLKDWERYDVSRYVDPLCVSPEEGIRSVPLSRGEKRHGTIKDDLDRLAASDCMDNAIFLFHSPPYRSNLDRAALDGKQVDHVPLDVHVGSIAIRRFIEARRPLLTLHGHVHESARLTGAWSDRIGRTHLFSAAHDGPELALVRFDLAHLEAATRDLL